MPFSMSMFSMPMCSWIRHQSFLIVFRLFEIPIFLPLRSCIRKMRSRARTAMQPPSWTQVAPSSTVRRMSAWTWIGGYRPPKRTRLSRLWM